MNPREFQSHPGSFFVFALLVCFSTTGCTTLYDPSYASSHPPVYLSPVLDSEPELSKIEIKRIIPGSPAANVDLRKGDEIVAIEDEYLYRSSRRLYYLLLRLHEEKREILKINVWRKDEEHTFYLKPHYEPSKSMLGMKFKLLLPDGGELKSVQFVKEEVSSEGFPHETFCDFRDSRRVAVHSHLWGKDLLILEFSVYNNHKKKTIQVDPKDVVVRDSYGFMLYPAETEAILHKVYDIGKIRAVLDDPGHRSRDKAMEVSREINQLREDLNLNEFRVSEIPPQAPYYGALIYPLGPQQLPVTVDAEMGEEKFSATFELLQPEGAVLEG